MKKKYIKPELVNIITVEAGKPNNRSAERMGTQVMITDPTGKRHLQTNLRNTNIIHFTKFEISKTTHVTSNFKESNAFFNQTAKLTNTATASDEGPS